MKILKQFFAVLVFIFLSINFLSCMQQGGDIESQLGVPEAGEPPRDARPNSPLRRLFREISQQIGLSVAANRGEVVNPEVYKINQDRLESYYDAYSGRKILDLSFDMTKIRLRWEDFTVLFNEILIFMNSHDVKIIDLCGNYLTSNGIPALAVLAMLENSLLAAIILGTEGEIARERERERERDYVPRCNPICMDPKLSEIMKNFKGELNSSDGICSKISKHVLGGFLNCGQEEIDMDDVSAVYSSSKGVVVLDFGFRQYSLKKMLKNVPTSFGQKIAPAVSKVVMALLTVGFAWASTYYGKDLFASSACDIADVQQYLIGICEFNSTMVISFFGGS